MRQFRRGCASTDFSACSSGELTGIQYKDCASVCEGDSCNNNLEVEKLFARLDENGKPVELECYSCSSELDPNGGGPGIGDNVPCYSNPGPEYIKTCPVYANQACFFSKMLTGTTDGLTEQNYHYKGKVRII